MTHRERLEMEFYVSNQYPGGGWRNKVSRMSDAQLTAVYLKLKARNKPAVIHSRQIQGQMRMEQVQ